MINSKFEVKCRKNCSAGEQGMISLGVGECSIEIRAAVPEENHQHPFGFLSFVLRPHKIFEGAVAKIEIRWQDVHIDTQSLGLMQPITIKLPLKSFKTPSILQIKLIADLGRSFYDRDFKDHSLSWADIYGFDFEPSKDEIGQRKHIIGAAQFCSRSIGLHGNYLSEARIDSLDLRVKEAVVDRKPFSAIRLGDGEGRVLGYPDFFSDMEVLTQVLYYHFGPESMHRIKEAVPNSWVRDAMLDLRRLLVKSVRDADVVGLPISEYYDGFETSPSSGMLGFACAMNHGLALVRHLDSESIFGANVFQLLAARGRLFRSTANLARKLHIVGPWDIRAELCAALGKEEINWIQVPGHYTWRGEKGLGQYPDLYKYIEHRLRLMDQLEGEVFLVGAGILGKYYCSLIKERGGVALDIGSVIDSWAKRGLPYAVGNSGISFEKL